MVTVSAPEKKDSPRSRKGAKKKSYPQMKPIFADKARYSSTLGSSSARCTRLRLP